MSSRTQGLFRRFGQPWQYHEQYERCLRCPDFHQRMLKNSVSAANAVSQVVTGKICREMGYWVARLAQNISALSAAVYAMLSNWLPLPLSPSTQPSNTTKLILNLHPSGASTIQMLSRTHSTRWKSPCCASALLHSSSRRGGPSRLETYPVSAVRTDVSVGEGDADERTDVDAEAEDEADAYVDSDAEADPEVELLEAVDASKSNSTRSSSSGWPQGGGLTMEWRVLFQIPNPHIIILVILLYSSSYLTLSCISHGIVPSLVTFAIPVLLQNAPWPSLACFDALFR
ncbi:hypothetical protein PC9H_009145 [Pleurotus ostreatus]|uniref:Uncharacterized protein n=1 Tax=Pleurotus ostreatus TaxID=5322 RepID=A0A8H6ZUH1_PLEOS|nr:uncharacterized protein PC9H_009145 [Pleurotus ostreatus]KAF7426776.1 hypothetical protein PC9H_009145 [Pleurotus ostreatus]